VIPLRLGRRGCGMAPPLTLYADGPLGAGLPGTGVQARLADGTVLPLAIERFVGPADATDARILPALRAPVLDVGLARGGICTSSPDRECSHSASTSRRSRSSSPGSAPLADGGEVLVELEPPRIRTTETRARLEMSGTASASFPWARVAAPDIGVLAGCSGFETAQRWTHGRRWFARLVKPPRRGGA
jgi:hypothetical protein